MKVIVFGAGVYVRGGRDLTSPLGNIGGALIEGHRRGLLRKAYILSASSSSDFAARKINEKIKSDFVEALTPQGENLSVVVEQNKITLAIVALPDHLHFEYVRKCGELGLHTITVKPFVETLAEADELINLFERKRLFGCVEFHKRFDYSNQLAKESLADEEISRVFVDYSQDRSVVLEDFSKWAERSNVFQYLGVHYVDLIHWLTGAVPLSVKAFRSGRSLRSAGVYVDDNVDVIVTWRYNGHQFNSVHLTSWAENHGEYCPSRQKIEILTDKQRIESEQAYRGFKIIGKSGVRIVNPYFSKAYSINNITRYKGYGIDAYLAFFEVVSKITSGAKNLDVDDRLCTFESARHSVFVTEEVKKELK